MKKIYCFYLHGYHDEINSSNYPAIEGLDIISGNNISHVLYAWTPNKEIRKIFKHQRDMDKFHEVTHEIPKEDFNKFSDEYADTFLEERIISTKDIINGVIGIKSVYILTTSKELEVLIDSDKFFLRKKLQPVIDIKFTIDENIFTKNYRKSLELFKFNDILSYTFPYDDSDVPPFNIYTEDSLAIYSNLYFNTYRKDITKL